MTPLDVEIRARIRRDGPISVADYMAASLAHPDHGYYRTRDPLGAAGDFVTSPEISQMFGELIGLWCATTWQQMGAPATVRLVELGPGRGTLIGDALRAAAAVPAFRAALDVNLVEIGPVLRVRQQDVLAAAGVGVEPRWVERLDQVPDGPMILIANEFFDALPVRQYVHRNDGWHERHVGLDHTGEALCFVVADHAVTPATFPPTFPPTVPSAANRASDGAIFEVCEAASALAAEIGARLCRDAGAALIVDYGPAESTVGDSFQAVRDHRYHEILLDAGEADLTAHVNFAALAAAARGAGAASHGPLAQGEFLRRIGIEARMERLCATASAEQAAAVRSGGGRLIDAHAMGTLFKAMALTPPAAPAPAGFEIHRVRNPRGAGR